MVALLFAFVLYFTLDSKLGDIAAEENGVNTVFAAPEKGISNLPERFETIMIGFRLAIA
jgi:hypothetical protein